MLIFCILSEPVPKRTDVKLWLDSNGTPTDRPPSAHPPNDAHRTQNWKDFTSSSQDFSCAARETKTEKQSVPLQGLI